MKWEVNMELKYSTVRERDMDLMLLEAIGSDKHFAKLIVERTKWGGLILRLKQLNFQELIQSLVNPI